MKYVITDKGKARIGTGYHINLAKGLPGKVVSAGLCEIDSEGKYRVYGSSLGFSLNSKPHDADILNHLFAVDAVK
ncbi:MAG: hypothetical protein AAB875_07130 [Patescibacteria group bacterium]